MTSKQWMATGVVMMALLGCCTSGLMAQTSDVKADGYWKKYAAEGNAAVKRDDTLFPSVHGIALGVGFRSVNDVSMDFTPVSLAYTLEEREYQWTVFGEYSPQATMKNGLKLLLSNSQTTGLFYRATMLALGGGVQTRVGEFLVGLDFRFLGLTDSANSTSLGGYSIGLNGALPVSLSKNVVLTPYAALSYDMFSTATISGSSGSLLPGLNGSGICIGANLGYRF
ncbi:hypothetical protein EBR57_01275 [bacterium]|nr:hypothetical protein [bacterium]